MCITSILLGMSIGPGTKPRLFLRVGEGSHKPLQSRIPQHGWPVVETAEWQAAATASWQPLALVVKRASSDPFLRLTFGTSLSIVLLAGIPSTLAEWTAFRCRRALASTDLWILSRPSLVRFRVRGCETCRMKPRSRTFWSSSRGWLCSTSFYRGMGRHSSSLPTQWTFRWRFSGKYIIGIQPFKTAMPACSFLVEHDIFCRSDRASMGRRYIEVYQGKRHEYYSAIATVRFRCFFSPTNFQQVLPLTLYS